MHRRLPTLLALGALALLPASVSALTTPFPLDSTTILSGNDALDAALPAPVESSIADRRGAVSDDGRFVAFSSRADGLSTEDDDRVENVFVKDRTTGAVILASRRDGAQGEPSHGHCRSATISDDGTLVAMECAAPLDAADGNTHRDVYVRDLTAGTTALISRIAGGAVANDEASEPMISGDGSAVVYTSTATNLAAADGNSRPDVYRRSLGGLPATLLVSRGAGAGGAVGDAYSNQPSVSDDGNTVAFASKAANLRATADANAHLDVYVRDINAGTTTLASAPDISDEAIGNGDSYFPSISGQRSAGQYYVAFTSGASNLGAVDSNGDYDVYRRALGNGATALISRAAGGAAANGWSQSGGIDDSGAHVAFNSSATDLDPADASPTTSAYTRHVGAGTTELLSRASGNGPELDNSAGAPALSGDATAYVWHSEGGGGLPDADPVRGNLFARDFDGAIPSTELVARPPGSEPFVNAGASAWLTRSSRTVSADGTRVAFKASRGGLLSQAFVRDTQTGALILASRADGPDGAASPREAFSVTISADGRRVAFLTDARLDPADGSDSTSAYVRDLTTGRTYLASRADGGGGADANHKVYDLALSGDGNRVAFATQASNLGDGDATPNYDIHVRDLAAGTTTLATAGGGGAPGDGMVYAPSLDADGSHIAFVSSSTNLGDGDSDGIEDVHVRDLGAATTRLVSRVPGGPKGDAASGEPTISSDGAVVAFMSAASTLVPDGVRHVLVRDLRQDTLTIADRADGANGAPADQYAGGASISGDGRSVVWTSPATNLVAGVASQTVQAYVRDLAGHTTRLVSRAGGAGGAPVELAASHPALSADGACAVFVTAAALAPGAGTDFPQVYMRALKPGCVPALPAAPGGGAPGGAAARRRTSPPRCCRRSRCAASASRPAASRSAARSCASACPSRPASRSRCAAPAAR